MFGIGHGAGTPAYFLLGDYFGSLDSGSRENMIRYDTPAIGPVSAAVSVANNDRVSGQISLSTEFGGTSFGAKVATLQEKGEPSTMGASFGATMANGLTVSGAWAKGDDHLSEVSAGLQFICEAISEEDCDAHRIKAAMAIQDALDKLEDGEEYRIDPNYFQAEIGYRFGNTGVAVSWYQSEDFVIEGSKGTAIGIGARHTFPKAGAEIYTAVQNYDAEMYKDAKSVDQTVSVVGTRRHVLVRPGISRLVRPSPGRGGGPSRPRATGCSAGGVDTEAPGITLPNPGGDSRMKTAKPGPRGTRPAGRDQWSECRNGRNGGARDARVERGPQRARR